MAGDMNWRHASALGIHLSLLVVVAWGRWNPGWINKFIDSQGIQERTRKSLSAFRSDHYLKDQSYRLTASKAAHVHCPPPPHFSFRRARTRSCAQIWLLWQWSPSLWLTLSRRSGFCVLFVNGCPVGDDQSFGGNNLWWRCLTCTCGTVRTFFESMWIWWDENTPSKKATVSNRFTYDHVWPSGNRQIVVF